MKNTIYVFTLVLTGLLLGANASAFTSPRVILTATPEINVIQGQFDVLGLDLTILPPSGQPDTLKALTIKNFGTAAETRDIDRLVLWQDVGPAGWQGMGIDQNLGAGVYHSGLNIWYWQNLSVNAPSAGVRLFASAEINRNPTNNRTIQLSVPLAMDNGAYAGGQTGVFNIGDQGVFFASGEVGPTDAALVNPTRQTIRNLSAENLAPKAVITSLSDGEVITDGEVLITGIARDQGVSTPRMVSILIDGQTFDVITTGANYQTWEYRWLAPSVGSHQLAVRAEDWLSNVSGVQNVITVTVSAPVIEPPSIMPPVFPPAPELIPTIAFGSLIKASLPAIYYYGLNAKRYVFPNEQTYKTWYVDFSQIIIISDAALGQIPIGGNVTYRPGVKLIKITTDPKVYAVDKGGALRWVKNESLARLIFGDDWAKLVDDVPDAFFVNYTLGAPIESQLDYLPTTVRQTSPDISVDKGLR